VATLDDVSIEALGEGRLQPHSTFAERRRRRRERPPSTWSLTYEGFDPERQGLREALCALGNGFFVTRGALAEASADGVNYPGTCARTSVGTESTWACRHRHRDQGPKAR
jgi:hypothetical protein